MRLSRLTVVGAQGTSSTIVNEDRSTANSDLISINYVLRINVSPVRYDLDLFKYEVTVDYDVS